MDNLDNIEQEIINWIETNTGLVVTFLALSLALLILTIVAMWILFKKAGEPGWKSIIPFYNIYIWCKIVWDKNIFWVLFGLTIGGSLLSTLIGGAGGLFISSACGIAEFVLYILICIKTSYAYGRGAGTAVGLIFLNTIFTLILAFGNATYVGPQKKNAN